MKIAIVGGSSLVALVAGQLDLSVGLAGETGSLERLTEKRYQQLITQMNYYNPQFDPRLERNEWPQMTSNDTFFRRYWGYGCNCFHLSDRPMTDGLGLAVVDKLDDTCKKYKGTITIHGSYYMTHIIWVILNDSLISNQFQSASNAQQWSTVMIVLENWSNTNSKLSEIKFNVKTRRTLANVRSANVTIS